LVGGVSSKQNEIIITLPLFKSSGLSVISSTPDVLYGVAIWL